jgi:hypothetical protein
MSQISCAKSPRTLIFPNSLVIPAKAGSHFLLSKENNKNTRPPTDKVRHLISQMTFAFPKRNDKPLATAQLASLEN